MKKFICVLALAASCLGTFAQGTIFFNNRTSTGDFPIYGPDGVSGAGMLGTVHAQLFLVTGSGANATYTALNPATTFRTTSPAASFFVNPVDVTVPGIAAGNSATVVVRMWLGDNFEVAKTSGIWGETLPLTISALGGVNPTTGAIVPTPDLAGLGSLVLVPEPSTIALGILGAAALLYRRRS